jgi:serine kinase of HPr protein (carbohydrate metabolism regulator)
METGNRHATLVLVGDRGVLVTGPSGAGKSRLALDLIDHAAGFAMLVADDRVIIERRVDGRYVGSAPGQISGLIEMHGAGIVARPNEPRAVIDLVVEMVDASALARMPEPEKRDGIMFIRTAIRDCGAARQHIAEALHRLNS